MIFAIGNFMFLGLLIITLIGISVALSIINTHSIAFGIGAGIIVSIAIFIGVLCGISLYNTSIVSGLFIV